MTRRLLVIEVNASDETCAPCAYRSGYMCELLRMQLPAWNVRLETCRNSEQRALDLGREGGE